MASEDIPQLGQQRRSLFELGRKVWPPGAPPCADASDLESQEAEAVASFQVYGHALVFVDLDMESGQLLPQSPGHRLAQPRMDRILKGAAPGELPFQQPTKFNLVIHAKTAREFGVPIPRSLLLSADRIEEQ